MIKKVKKLYSENKDSKNKLSDCRNSSCKDTSRSSKSQFYINNAGFDSETSLSNEPQLPNKSEKLKLHPNHKLPQSICIDNTPRHTHNKPILISNSIETVSTSATSMSDNLPGSLCRSDSGIMQVYRSKHRPTTVDNIPVTPAVPKNPEILICFYPGSKRNSSNKNNKLQLSGYYWNNNVGRFEMASQSPSYSEKSYYGSCLIPQGNHFTQKPRHYIQNKTVHDIPSS